MSGRLSVPWVGQDKLVASTVILALCDVCVCTHKHANMQALCVKGPMNDMKLKTQSLGMVSNPLGNMQDPSDTAGCVGSATL